MRTQIINYLLTKPAGRLENGYLILDVKAENRYNVDIAMSQGYFGAIKVIAHEI